MLIALIFTIPFIVINNNKTSTSVEVEEKVSPSKGELIGGIYYASANEETGASQAPSTSKGAIYVGNGSTMTISGGLISGHEALYGGAIYVANGGSLTVSGGEISNNTSRLGGAIYVEAGGTVEFTGGTITGNYAEPITGSIGGDGTAAVYAEYGATVTTPNLCTINNNISQYYGNYIIYNVDGVEKWVGIGFEEDPSFDAVNLTNAPLDYNNCPGYFSDNTFVTEVTTVIEFEQDGTYSPASSSKTFKKYASGLYTKTATNDKLTFTLSNGTYSVTKNGTPTGEVVIPKKYNNVNVTSIGEAAFQNCTGLTGTLTIPNSVTSIGRAGFANCSNLTGVVIGNGVTNIGISAFYNCSGLTSITIGSGVTSIGDSAFQACTSVTEINYNANITTFSSSAFYQTGQNGKGTVLKIGNNVTAMPANAFRYCTGLTEVTIPASVTGIGNSAFYGCTGLTRINYGGDIEDWFGITFGSWKTNSWTLYIDNSAVTDLIIPNTVTTIPAYALYYCSGLTSVKIGSGVTSIGSDAFSGCSGLTSITIPNSVTSIGSYAFQGCSGLTNVTIGSGVTSIGNSAFRDCSGLTEINYNANTSTAFTSSSNIFTGAGQGGNGITLTIGNNVTTIPAYLFSTAPTLVAINFGSGVISIGEAAFQNCTGLTGTLTIPNSVTSIGRAGFANCSNLTGVVTGNGVTNIGISAFYNCSGLTSITIGSGVTSIGDSAFQACTSVTEINYNANNTTFSSSAFYQTGQNGKGMVLKIGNNVTAMPAYMFQDFTWLTQFIVDENNVVYASRDGILYNKEKTEIVVVPAGITGSVSLPNTLTSIGNSLFYGFTGLTSITIPASVTSIGNNAFRDCSGLTEINYNANISTAFTSSSNIFTGAGQSGTGIILNIGNNVTTIPEYLFYGYGSVEPKLVTINFGSGVISIGEAAFQNCTGLTGTLTIPDSVTSIGRAGFANCSNLTGVVIGNGVTNIGISAFYNCTGLTGVLTIPDSVTSIGEAAFKQCTGIIGLKIGNGVTSIGEGAFFDTANLTRIDYGASIADWCKINFQTNWKNEEWTLYLNGVAVTNLEITSNITSIPDHAFSGNTGLASVKIPSSVTSIGRYAFRRKSDGSGPHINIYYSGSLVDWLTNIEFSDYWVLGNWTLYINDTAVTNLAIPNGITEIPDWAFYFNSGITNVTMADSVTSVGTRAFMRCSNLETVTIGAGVQTIGDRAFNDCTSLEKIYIPSTVITIVNAAGTSAKGIFADSSTSAQIYTDVASQANIPAGWDQYFNYYDANTQLTVNYGYSKSQFEAL